MIFLLIALIFSTTQYINSSCVYCYLKNLTQASNVSQLPDIITIKSNTKEFEKNLATLEQFLPSTNFMRLTITPLNRSLRYHYFFKCSSWERVSYITPDFSVLFVQGKKNTAYIFCLNNKYLYQVIYTKKFDENAALYTHCDVVRSYVFITILSEYGIRVARINYRTGDVQEEASKEFMQHHIMPFIYSYCVLARNDQNNDRYGIVYLEPDAIKSPKAHVLQEIFIPEINKEYILFRIDFNTIEHVMVMLYRVDTKEFLLKIINTKRNSIETYALKPNITLFMMCHRYMKFYFKGDYYCIDYSQLSPDQRNDNCIKFRYKSFDSMQISQSSTPYGAIPLLSLEEARDHL